MKQFFTILFFWTGASAASAQTPLYIQFDQACMSQLEYRYTYTGQDLLMYAINKNEDELYFFKIGGNTPITTPTQPKGTVSCRNVNLNSGEVNAINAGGRLAYIVHKVQSGYLSMPVEAAGQIFRAGTSFVFRSPNYDFLLDTAHIDYARNLSQPGVVSPVYLTGIRDIDCRRQYSFRLEPLSGDLQRMDIEVIPGIGIVSNRAGRNGSEMEQNVYRLLKINGVGMEDYIYEICRRTAQTNNTDPFISSGWPQNPSDGNNDNSPFMEPDKEGYNPRPSGQESNPAFSNCPEKPGFGYHLVQPGESLHSIARTYNLDARSLAGWNKITDVNKIEVCQKIWLSPQSGTGTPNTGYKEHVVQKGETLAGIARKYNLTESSLRKMNSLAASGNVVINPGQRLVVSSGQGNPLVANTGTGGGTGGGTGPTVVASSQQYRVRKGETITSVSRKYGYTTEYFRHINRQLRNLPADDNTAITEGVILTVSDSKCERPDLATFKPAELIQGAGTWGTPNNKPSVATDPLGKPAVGTGGGGGTGARFEYVGEYIVKTGDTMLSIARQYGLPVEKLAAANGFSAGREPQPREILKIPK